MRNFSTRDLSALFTRHRQDIKKHTMHGKMHLYYMHEFITPAVRKVLNNVSNVRMGVCSGGKDVVILFD